MNAKHYIHAKGFIIQCPLSYCDTISVLSVYQKIISSDTQRYQLDGASAMMFSQLPQYARAYDLLLNLQHDALEFIL